MDQDAVLAALTERVLVELADRALARGKVALARRCLAELRRRLAAAKES